MAAPGATVATNTTGNMALNGDAIADFESPDLAPTFNNFTTEFMANGEWHRNCFTSPVVPLINVNVGTANRSAADFDEDVVMTWLRNIDIFEPNAALGFQFD